MAKVQSINPTQNLEKAEAILKETLTTATPQTWRTVRNKLGVVTVLLKKAAKQYAPLQRANADLVQAVTFSKMRLQNWKFFVDDLLEKHAKDEIGIGELCDQLGMGPCNKIKQCPKCKSLAMDPDDARLECPHCKVDMVTIDE